MRELAEQSVTTLIADQAEAHEASVLRRVGDILTVVVRVRRPGGKIVPYTLRIETDSLEPKAREVKPEHLPTFCPNRHINDGGYFCLSFKIEDPLPVWDADGARAWWARLLKYLNLQETTSALRRWPSTKEWAHGIAAIHQCRAERCATALGPRFVQALDRRRLSVKKWGSSFIQLRDGDTRLYSVWLAVRRVATLSQPCLCGSGKPIVACSDHAARAAELAFALLDWRAAEKEFWDLVRGKACCGSLRDCPLNTATMPTAANENPPAKAA